MLSITIFLIPRIYSRGRSSPADISQKRGLGGRKEEQIIHNTNDDHFNGVVFMCPSSPGTGKATLRPFSIPCVHPHPSVPPTRAPVNVIRYHTV
jgi:hypothetical protein